MRVAFRNNTPMIASTARRNVERTRVSRDNTIGHRHRVGQARCRLRDLDSNWSHSELPNRLGSPISNDIQNCSRI
ncbi:hypothetical protein CH260_15600 [Rhodococcus sp. 05-2256-B2]|nr:hypothetical protein CH258_20940 [Rhodococcus sp. 05-2256-B4]OZD94848.1 hypothetical protein CH260_15600 [Rhodococcus sp. 05-2256-B2]